MAAMAHDKLSSVHCTESGSASDVILWNTHTKSWWVAPTPWHCRHLAAQWVASRALPCMACTASELPCNH